MHPMAIVELVDGVRVAVPDSLNLITPYVLLEQHDWFEDEIKFLRRMLRPGDQVIDIGANYGVYALSMAKTVGATGRVWAFEPASETAGLLEHSISANAFGHVHLSRCAVSNDVGTGQLAVGPHAELNALVGNAAPGGRHEPVVLTSLDVAIREHQWRDIAFIKIDAEGEETNILRGGARFLAELSPLVQYELKHGADWHLELVRCFRELGYSSYRLLPGLDALLPFDPAEPIDGFLLNLFACKPDRAEILSDRGHLVTHAALDEARAALRDPRARERLNQSHHWAQSLRALPFAATLGDLWAAQGPAVVEPQLAEALSLYMASTDRALSLATRCAALEAAQAGLAACSGDDSPRRTRLVSLARASQSLGLRGVALDALGRFFSGLAKGGPINTAEPFLPPGERFDGTAAGRPVENWLACAALEQLEVLSAYSSFYSGPAVMPRLEAIRRLGFGTAEMARRMRLIERRFASATH